MGFFSNLYYSAGQGFSNVWRRLTFQHYDPSAFEVGLIEQLEGSEYDPRLKARQGVVIFERMSREDSRLATALSLLKEPIMAATWKVEASSDRVKKFIEDNLGLSDKPTTKVKWGKVLNEMLTSVEIGFSLHEITWRLMNEMEHLRAVSFRPQLSVESFEDDGDYLTAVNQIKQLRPEKKLVRISAKRLMYHSFNVIGTDHWGRSTIRPAYRDWYFKEALLTISMIEAKRLGASTPHASYRSNVSKKAQKQMFEMLQSWSLDKRSALVTPAGEDQSNPDWQMGLFGPEKGRQTENMPLLGYFDDNLAKICLVLFLDLGSIASGNRALGDTFADILYNSLEARCDLVCESANQQLIDKMVEKNFGNGEWAKMTWANLELHNMERFVEALARLCEVFPIELMPGDQERIWEILKLPMRRKGEEFKKVKPEPRSSHNMEGVGSTSGKAKASVHIEAPTMAEVAQILAEHQKG